MGYPKKHRGRRKIGSKKRRARKRNKKKVLPKNNLASAKLIGLDKITAKTSEIIINLGETKKFGPLEIKVLKCGKINSDDKNNSVASCKSKICQRIKMKKFLFLMGGHLHQIQR